MCLINICCVYKKLKKLINDRAEFPNLHPYFPTDHYYNKTCTRMVVDICHSHECPPSFKQPFYIKEHFSDRAFVSLTGQSQRQKFPRLSATRIDIDL